MDRFSDTTPQFCFMSVENIMIFCLMSSFDLYIVYIVSQKYLMFR